MNRQTIVVTGGAGFVGAALCSTLLQRGHRVVVLDQQPPADALREHPNASFVEGDVRDEALVGRLIEACDRVAHLAAIAGVDEYMQRPLDVLETNVIGTRNVLMACARYGRPVLNVSSSEVYGRNSAVLGEDSDSVFGSTRRQRWSYATSKRVGEHYAQALGGEGLCHTSVRYFNVYGPLLDSPGRGRVLSKFLGAVRDGNPLELVDGGDAVRCFCYVDDAAEATARLLLSLAPDAPQAGRAVNVGNDVPYTMRELAEQVIALSGHLAGTVDVDGEAHFGAGFEDIEHRVPDVSLLAQTVDFHARTTLTEGLRKTLDHWGLLAPDPAGPSANEPTLPVPRIPNLRPELPASPALLGRIGRVLRSGQATNCGPNLRELETRLARWLDVRRVAVVSSGSDALLLGARALGLSGVAIVPSYTYIATAAAFSHAGLEVVFCDIDRQDFTLCPEALERLLDEQPDVACVAPVNVFGVPPRMDRIAASARDRGARVLYDCAHGLGTERGGSRVEAGADLSCYSMHATKLLTAIEGGFVVAKDERLLDEIIRLRSHGLGPGDRLDSGPGYNAKMDEVRALVALEALENIDTVLERRQDYGRRLHDSLSSSEQFVPQVIPEDVRCPFVNLGALVEPLPSAGLTPVIAALEAHGVMPRRYFDPPLHQMRDFAGGRELPVTTSVWERLLCLPMHSRMSAAELAQMEQAIGAIRIG